MTNLLALFLFPVLSALGANFVVYHSFKPGAILSKLGEECASLDNPYSLPSTGYPAVDQQICGLISFFHTMFDPAILPFTIWFMAALVPVVTYITLEAHRLRNNKNASFMTKHSTITGLMIQTLSYGFTMPLYWLFSITSGSIYLRPSSTAIISRSYAQAIFLAVLIGLVVPTVCMLGLQIPYATFAWQLFPVYIGLVQGLYSMVVGSSSKSGYAYIRAMYTCNFLVNAYIHLSFILTRINDIPTLEALLVPTVSSIDISEPEYVHSLHTLQWDLYIGLGSSVLATLWFAKSVGQFLGILSWYLMALPAFGPGAAFAIVALWRESSLHSVPVQTIKKGKQ